MIGAPTKSRHEMVEALAREICKAAGQKPDDRRTVRWKVREPLKSGATTHRAVRRAVWRTFAPEARVALRAIDKLGYALFKKTPTDVLTKDSAVVDLADPAAAEQLHAKLRKLARQHLSCDGR